MKHIILSVALVLFSALSANAEDYDWKGGWILPTDMLSKPNIWISFRKEFDAETLPQSLKARIGVDSRYWLWINGELVVREGGIKRGPNRDDTYCDIVEIAPYLKQGRNIIALLMWHFGRDGFSHNSSGKPAMLFDAQSPELTIVSDRSWMAEVNPAFGDVETPHSNFRLPESDICYDAGRANEGWQLGGGRKLKECSIIGRYGESPWHELVPNPLPMWKDGGVKDYSSTELRRGAEHDTLVCRMPYNTHAYPRLSFADAPEGEKVLIETDNYVHFKVNNNRVPVHAEYITKAGAQEFECYDWLNGHEIYYIIPAGGAVPDVSWRETGYDACFAGSFHCSDEFWNRYWEKAARTLYVNMFDTYYDCPDRERAQWTGDSVNNAEQSFFMLSRSADALGRKWLHEICDWQKPDGAIYAPVPSGNWAKELCGQSLSSIGYFGLWNFYMHSGDISILEDTYDAVDRYLKLWTTLPDGTVNDRRGEWVWGDWGKEIDQTVLTNALYYHAVRGHYEAAKALGRTDDAARMETWMARFKEGFNARFWNGKAYRSENYAGKTDDRSQALPAVIGLVPEERYPAVMETLMEEWHASPYMERYVMQACFEMGFGEKGLSRAKERFREMTDDPRFTTLFEFWQYDSRSTVNHAWSGGAVISLARYVAGVTPVEPGYTTFRIEPHPCGINEAEITVPSVRGEIKSHYIVKGKKLTLEFTVPEGTECITCIGGIEKTWAPGSYRTSGPVATRR